MKSIYLTFLKLILLAVALAQSGCSKTVQWEEEVPLNTGETIWVTRTVTYTYQGGAGNPLDMAFRPDDTEIIEFTWNGKKYRYEGDASIFLLAISPMKYPVLVASAADQSWNWEHNYFCVKPFYVQLIPDPSARIWSWPPAIDTWLYGMQSNLMLSRHPPSEMKKRYSMQERKREDSAGALQTPSQAGIDPSHESQNCKKRSYANGQ